MLRNRRRGPVSVGWRHLLALRLGLGSSCRWLRAGKVFPTPLRTCRLQLRGAASSDSASFWGSDDSSSTERVEWASHRGPYVPRVSVRAKRMMPQLSTNTLEANILNPEVVIAVARLALPDAPSSGRRVVASSKDVLGT
jgi:hypothetical protein